MSAGPIIAHDEPGSKSFCHSKKFGEPGHLRISVWYHGQRAQAPFSEEPKEDRILRAGQEVLDPGRQLGHQAGELVDPFP
jgi:hypothetical protein